MNRYWIFIIILSLFCGISCQKMDAPKCEFMDVYYRQDTAMIFCSATVTNNGGMSYIAEKGYCYSFNPDPSHLDSQTIFESVSKTEEFFFEWTMDVDVFDTIYYIRAYVKNNAGTGYSKVMPVSTRIEF